MNSESCRRVLCAPIAFCALLFAADATRADNLLESERKWLSERGISLNFVLTDEVLANVSGGLKRGAVTQNKWETLLTADLEKMAGLKGLSFFANTFLIFGTERIAADLVGNFNTISNIEARPTLRLSEAWFEQKFLGDMASIRIGQLAADAEFFISDYSDFFMNSDWPSITAQNLPSGGPAYPLSTPAIRFKFQPSKQFTFLTALFNGDPSGPGPGDAEIKNRYGLNFRVQDPPLWISELQYRNEAYYSATGLAGFYRLGAWYHFGEFDSQRFDANGLSLANPFSTGIAARLRGSFGIYGVIDQQIYRVPGGGVDSGIGIFSRISASPADRNLIDFYIDGGIVFSGMIKGRPNDKFGATFIYANISSAARALDQDAILYSGIAQPIRDFELTVAIAYLAQISPGWTIQPEIHYVIHPGGNVAAPGSATSSVPIPNSVVLALRSVLKY